MILAYNTLTVELPAPQLGDTLKLVPNALVRKTTAGEVGGINVSTWPTSKVHNYKFIINTYTIQSDDTILRLIDELRSFLIDTAGLEITIDGVSGIITTQVVDIITQFDNTNYEVTFDFEET